MSAILRLFNLPYPTDYPPTSTPPTPPAPSEEMVRTKRYVSPETREKMAAAKLGKKLSIETRAKISETINRQGVSAETRAKISAAKLGKRHSEATKIKISDAKLGVPNTAKWSIDARCAASSRAIDRADAARGPAGYGKLRLPSTMRESRSVRHESITMDFDGYDTIQFTPEQYKAFWDFSGLPSDRDRYETILFELLPKQRMAICHGFRTLNKAKGLLHELDGEIFGALRMPGGSRHVKSSVLYFEAEGCRRTTLMCLVTTD